MKFHGALSILAAAFPLACDRPADSTVTLANDSGPDTGSQNEAELPSDTSAARWRVTADGVGPVRFGSPIAEVAAALRTDIEVPTLGPEECEYIFVDTEVGRLQLMVVGDTVVRLDVDTDQVTTREGARVGDTKLRIQQLYGASLTMQPHKYIEGEYLIYTPADTTFRLIFETDGTRVTSFRAGRRPQVEWVEGCS